MKYNLKKLTPLIGILLLLYILYQINLTRLFSIIGSTDISILLFAVLVSFSSLLIMNLRWGVIMKSMGIKVPYLESLSILAKGVALGAVTPGKVGELYRAKYLMDNTGKTAGVCFSTVIVDRILDLIALLFTGSVCMGIFILTYLTGMSFLVILIFAAATLVSVLGVIFFWNEERARFIIRPVFNFLVPEKHKKKLKFEFAEFYSGIKSMGICPIVFGLFYTLLNWLVVFAVVYLICLSLGFDVSFGYVSVVYPIMVLVNLIPISVFGLGTTQFSSIFLFGVAGVSAESAVALSFLMIAVLGFFYALPGGILYMINK